MSEPKATARMMRAAAGYPWKGFRRLKRFGNRTLVVQYIRLPNGRTLMVDAAHKIDARKSAYYSALGNMR